MIIVKCNLLKELEIIFIIVVLYGSNVLTQKMSMGFCPPIEPMSFFNVNEYMGTWYQQASVKSLLKALHSCVEYNFTADSHGGFHIESSYSTYRYPFPIKSFGYAKPEQYHGFPQKGAYKMTLFSDITNRYNTNIPIGETLQQEFPIALDHILSKQNYSIVYKNVNNFGIILHNSHKSDDTYKSSGVYKLKCGSVESRQDQQYIVLNTDYVTYSIIWSCRALVSSIIYRGESLQILSRERTFNTSVIVSSYQEILKRQMEDLYQYIETTNQTNCDHLYQQVEDTTVM